MLSRNLLQNGHLESLHVQFMMGKTEDWLDKVEFDVSPDEVIEKRVVQTRLALSGDENSFQKTAIEAPQADQIPNTNGSSKFLFSPPTQCILHLLKEPGAEELETLVRQALGFHITTYK
jgi:hypothetical protein